MATLQVHAEGAANVRVAVDGEVYQFEDGVLDVDDGTAEEIRRQGRTLFPHLDIRLVGDAPATGPKQQLDRMTLAELREQASGRGIETDGLTKAEIRALLEA